MEIEGIDFEYVQEITTGRNCDGSDCTGMYSRKVRLKLEQDELVTRLEKELALTLKSRDVFLKYANNASDVAKYIKQRYLAEKDKLNKLVSLESSSL